MSKFKIYQTKADYRFMPYEYVKDKVNINDYDLVAEFTTPEDTSLDTVYVWGNNGKLQQSYTMRSISVSDIIVKDDTTYYVDSFGFKELPHINA